MRKDFDGIAFQRIKEVTIFWDYKVYENQALMQK